MNPQTYNEAATNAVQSTLRTSRDAEGNTVYEFSVKLVDAGNPHLLRLNGPNNLIWALGGSRALVEHVQE